MICKNNYNTITHIHFQPYKLNDGTEELPVRVTDLTSAYTQTAYNHNPLPREVCTFKCKLLNLNIYTF